MQVLIVDSNDGRRAKLKSLMTSRGYQCTDYPQVNGEGVIGRALLWRDIEAKCRDVFKQADANVLLIHHNGNQNPFWSEFITLCCEEQALWCVSYSGGERARSVHERHHPFQGNVGSDGSAIWDLQMFLKAVEEGAANPFHALMRYNSSMEAKLEILHLCLTPPAEEDVTSIKRLRNELGKGQAMRGASDINAIWKDEAGLEGSFSGSFGEAVGALAREANCFSSKYMAILSEMRNSLLGG